MIIYYYFRFNTSSTKLSGSCLLFLTEMACKADFSNIEYLHSVSLSPFKRGVRKGCFNTNNKSKRGAEIISEK